MKTIYVTILSFNKITGKKLNNIFISYTVPSQTMTPHDFQGPTAPMSGTTTDNRPVQSTLTYTHSMQPPHPVFCDYI